ncbi:hypothetical protein SeMB42_g03987 [Synchytrium endobioticum]|uniref:Uncharacterized protein n=1 Tax=Synchytrium endobioticum TaxID=286115 RepID=A0A507D2F9_9FUNG|nr:hypothetical protein SeLEV6574_g04559 [Synchytrium endobioticum]TPX45485.1 hypothetical protein SeMB42_g03987 [Synchytrium endobioticum]
MHKLFRSFRPAKSRLSDNDDANKDAQLDTIQLSSAPTLINEPRLSSASSTTTTASGSTATSAALRNGEINSRGTSLDNDSTHVAIPDRKVFKFPRNSSAMSLPTLSSNTGRTTDASSPDSIPSATSSSGSFSTSAGGLSPVTAQKPPVAAERRGNADNDSSSEDDAISVSSLVPKSSSSGGDSSDDESAIIKRPRVRAPGHKSHHPQDQIHNITSPPTNLQVPAIVVEAPSPPRSRQAAVQTTSDNSNKRSSFNNLPKPSFGAHRHSAPSIQRNSLLDLSMQHQNMLRQQRQVQQQRATYYGGGNIGYGGPLLHIDPREDKPVFHEGLLGQVQQQEVLKEMRKHHPTPMTVAVAGNYRIPVHYGQSPVMMPPQHQSMQMIPQQSSQHPFAPHLMHHPMAQPMIMSHQMPHHHIIPPHQQHPYYNNMMPTPYAMSYIPYADADSDIDEDTSSALDRRELKERWLEQEREKNRPGKRDSEQSVSGHGVSSSASSSSLSGNGVNNQSRRSAEQSAKRASDVRSLANLQPIPASGSDSGTESNSASTSSSSEDDEIPLSKLSRPSSTFIPVSNNTAFPLFHNSSNSHASSSEFRSSSSSREIKQRHSSPILSVREVIGGGVRLHRPLSSSNLSPSFSVAPLSSKQKGSIHPPSASDRSKMDSTSSIDREVSPQQLLNLDDFIKTCLSLQPMSTTSRSKMYSRYVSYMEEVSHGGDADEYMVPSMADFEMSFQEMGFSKKIRDNVGVWMNVVLL